MKVFVAGGTGTLGRPTVRALVAAGHAVRALVRGPERASLVSADGAEPVLADLFDARAMQAAIAGSEAVLHLATRIPPLTAMRRRAAWRENDRLRNQGTSILVNAALATSARIYVQESITFLYADRGDEVLYETAPLAPAFPVSSARDAEREAERFGIRGGQGVVLRFGSFYAPYAPSTLETVRLARRRLFPVLGSGTQFVSPIHVDDAAAAVVGALGVAAGIYNVVDDAPLPLADYVGALTDAFGFRPAFRLPEVLARVMIGPASEVLLRSQRVANTMFKAVSGWTPRHANAREGWRAVAEELRRA